MPVTKNKQHEWETEIKKYLVMQVYWYYRGIFKGVSLYLQNKKNVKDTE